MVHSFIRLALWGGKQVCVFLFLLKCSLLSLITLTLYLLYHYYHSLWQWGGVEKGMWFPLFALFLYFKPRAYLYLLTPMPSPSPASLPSSSVRSIPSWTPTVYSFLPSLLNALPRERPHTGHPLCLLVGWVGGTCITSLLVCRYWCPRRQQQQACYF